MKTESHSINDVLAKNATSFFIPPFQRAYAWGRPEIERYFSDISRIIESELDDKQHDKLEHFFGTVVIKEEKAGFANKSVVVDGQQRLTTTPTPCRLHADPMPTLLPRYSLVTPMFL